MVRFQLLQRYLAAPVGGLLLLAAVAGASTDDDDDDEADLTGVAVGSVTLGAGGSASLVAAALSAS